jgi:dipeptidyl aminopeptidase/acylaminoacyl peptidase
MRFVASSLLALVLSVAGHAQSTLLPFPDPAKIVKDDKQFNATTLGPGNTFTVREAPDDFQLEAFDFSANETALFMEWKSGRLETRNIETGKRVAEIKPIAGPIWEAYDDPSGKRIIVVTKGGMIRFIDPQKGRKISEIEVEKGRFNYDIQKVLIAPDGSWLAYVNRDNGKVLDLSSGSPKAVANLDDGYDMALSPDQTTLWVINRNKIFGLKVSDWSTVGTAPLLDQVKPDQTPNLAVLSSGNSTFAYIPSQSGLLKYDLPSLQGRKATSVPTYWVGADREHHQLFVHEFKVSALYTADGAVKCRWQIHPAQDFKMSPSGKWLGDRLFGKVELWSTGTLMACDPPAKN